MVRQTAAGVHSSDDPASGVGDVATYAGGTVVHLHGTVTTTVIRMDQTTNTDLKVTSTTSTTTG